jgi:uncharacterized protein (TIGR02171 family)
MCGKRRSGIIRYHKDGCVFLLGLAISCAPLVYDRDHPADYTSSGMKKIAAAGKTFSQGWNNSSASYDERPGMESGFTYDYWLDSTEVTQKQYYEVTGKYPVPSGSPHGVGDNYPVYRVSWFDAVLYCNARSKAEGADTVYVYSGVKVLSNGSVYELTGLWYDMSRNGYRLPTEAEWEYAARDGSSALHYCGATDSNYANNHSWYGSNSSDMAHSVGTLQPNSLGLYDMAGNVFEWTNDWKVMYTGQDITNSLGSLQPGNEYEKVIKGGSYNYPLTYLRPSHRSATYVTMISSANEYVGFRCARGTISNGQYIGTGQMTFSPNPVTIMTCGSDLRSFLGTSEAKLVFVNVTGTNRTLCHIDFSRTFPYVREYLDDRNVYHPTISPDGRFVAYCSRNEGQTGPSKISIRSLDSLNTPIVQLGADTGYLPRWWINPVTWDTSIVYTNSGIDNDNPMWSATKTYLQRMSGGTPAGVAQELISNGSYHDGVSVSGRRAVTGFTRLRVKDIWAGKDTVLFVPPQNGKDATGSTQVCNVSISPDTGDEWRSMFLDFGYPRTSGITGTSYGVHEYLFVSNVWGQISYYLRCPSDEQSWDGTEWTNQSRYAVGCGRNSANQAHSVYAIALDFLFGRNYLKLVNGTELQQPYLLMGASMDSLPDSLGLYNEPPTDYIQAWQATKLLMFWRNYHILEVAMLGSSEAQVGFDPSKISGLMAYNLAGPGGGLIAVDKLIRHYLLPHCSKLKVICSSLDIGWLWLPRGNFYWEEGLGNSNGYKYDASHDFWVQKAGMIDSLRDIVERVSLPYTYDLDAPYSGLDPGLSRGWNNGSGGVGLDVPPQDWLQWIVDDTNFQTNIHTIRLIADSLRSHQVHWIVVDFPVSPGYQGLTSYSPWGPSWQTAHDILDTLRKIGLANSYFHLYEANNGGNHDYDSIDACDENHLSAVGAAKLSRRIDSVIHAILP